MAPTSSNPTSSRPSRYQHAVVWFVMLLVFHGGRSRPKSTTPNRAFFIFSFYVKVLFFFSLLLLAPASAHCNGLVSPGVTVCLTTPKVLELANNNLLELPAMFDGCVPIRFVPCLTGACQSASCDVWLVRAEPLSMPVTVLYACSASLYGCPTNKRNVRQRARNGASSLGAAHPLLTN